MIRVLLAIAVWMLPLPALAQGQITGEAPTALASEMPTTPPLATAEEPAAWDDTKLTQPYDTVTSRSQWQVLRERLPDRMDSLRALAKRGWGAEDEWVVAMDLLEADAQRLAESATDLAPQQAATVAAATERLEKLLLYLARDVSRNDAQRVRSTLRLLDETVRDLEDASARVAVSWDESAGAFLVRPEPPSNWGAPRYQAPRFARGLGAMNARELLEEANSHAQRLQKLNRQQLEDDGLALSSELSEIARALLRRQGEVEVEYLRPAYQNTALRLEVVAENLADFAKEGDQANVRRQLAHVRDILQRADHYLRQRDALDPT